VHAAVEGVLAFPGKFALQRRDDAIPLCAHPSAVVNEGGSAGAVVVDDVEGSACGVEQAGVDAADGVGAAG
jgi:hypothetical protein